MVKCTVLALLALILGYVAGWWTMSRRSEAQMERVVAVAWGDGRYGEAFYGARVYLEPATVGYSVHAKVSIGRGDGYSFDCGIIGTAADDAAAVRRWGKIEFYPDGLHIGGYFLPREQMEAHR